MSTTAKAEDCEPIDKIIDSESESDDDEVEEDVDLGFAEIPEDSLTLHRALFPSKIGGQPAWLATPSKWTHQGNESGTTGKRKRFSCERCEKDLIFLLQIYTGGAWERVDTFHRNIYVFICGNETCYQDRRPTVLVLRAQLPKTNKYFSESPPDYDNPIATIKQHETSFPKLDGVCVICGFPGSFQCSACRAVNYCGRQHQKWHWKHMKHSEACNQNDASFPHAEENTHLPPELLDQLEIIMDQEPEAEEEKSPEELMAEFNALQAPKEVKQKPSAEVAQELKALTKRQRDKVFFRFRERIRRDPSQILRYCKGGSPLWLGEVFHPTTDIPSCPCGAKREFEFQIMPQLISILTEKQRRKSPLNDLDFGVIAVYTCPNSCVLFNICIHRKPAVCSCNIGDSYCEEFSVMNWVTPDRDDDSDAQVKTEP
eukprot:m.92483 g.92483  ORF g.92483 m.92483 type:complete len:428 (-) comp13353_c0_seq4:186-1469(-)